MEDKDSLETGTTPQDAEAQTSSDPSLAATSATTQSYFPDDVSVIQANETQNFQALLSEISRLRQDFETKVLYDQSKERIIDSLHKELQQYREGFHFHILRPVLLNLIGLYDDLGMLIEKLHADAATTHIAQNITIFQDVVEEILNCNGVTSFTVEQETFLPSRQRNLRVITTQDQAQDKCIARRIRKGFEYDGKQLRPEIVETYKYVAQPIETSS